MDLAQKVILAQNDRAACDQLISEYQNFIAACANKTAGKFITEHDDEMSIAMVAFNEAIQKYDIEKGNFLSFASLMIKNRLIDYLRKEYKTTKITPFSSLSQADKDGNEIDFDIEDNRADSHDLRYEIESINVELQRLNISFTDLSKDSPKSKKTKLACFKAIKFILNDSLLVTELIKHGTLPIKSIVENINVHRKVLERHRKYIITALIILNGEYEGLAEYFSGVKEVVL